MTLPAAILFDLDDTLIRAYAKPDEAWARLLPRFAPQLGVAEGDAARLDALRGAILKTALTYWQDPVRAAEGRRNIGLARRGLVAEALRNADCAADEALCHMIADGFTEMRRAEYALYPDAHAVVDALAARGVKLALITNGPADTQRAKVIRFDFERRFPHIQIEGEMGFGKPEPRAYLHALETLGVDPADAWMVGDNVEWEIAAPQRLGMKGVWCDHFGEGLPAHATDRPHKIIRTLSELLG